MGGIVSSIFGGGGSSGGGSSQPAPTSQNVTTSNIAPWAQAGVSDLINAGMGQVFNTNPDGSINVNSMKGYTPFNANTDAGQQWVQGAAGSVAGFSPLQQQAQANIANMQTPDEYGTAMNTAQQAGQGYLNTAGQANQYGQAGMAAGQAGMAAGNAYGQNAQNAAAVQSYMNPYLQATLNPAMQLQAQQFGQINAQNQGQATQQGAFGGGRQAVMQGLNQQNEMLAQNQLVGNAYNQAYNTANQNMQTAGAQAMQGAGLGISGANAGLAGVGAQQAGYGGVGSQATNLANIAGAKTQTGLNINAAQQQTGAVQQQNQQNILNQAMANYNTAQTYPMTQLAQLESMYTGAPQNITSSTYSAAPSTTSQLAGLAGTAIAGAKLAGSVPVATGGLLKGNKVKKMATGGIAKFAGKGSSLVGGAIGRTETSLENMTSTELENAIKTSTSLFIREKAKELLTGLAGANAGQTTFAAGGGIVAFADGGEAFTPDELYAGSYRDTPLPPVVTDPMQKKIVGLMDLYQNQYGYGKPSEDDKALRAQLKEDRANAVKDRDRNKWLALLEGSGAALAETSPFANVGIGKMIGTGAKSYAAGEKDYADQLKALRSGELDLNKLSSTDRNNLLHYASAGASAQQTAEDAAAARLQVSKNHMAEMAMQNGIKFDNKINNLATTLYKDNLTAAASKLGIDERTATPEQRKQIMLESLQQANEILAAQGKKGFNLEGKSGGPQVGAKDGGGAGTIRFDKNGNQIQG